MLICRYVVKVQRVQQTHLIFINNTLYTVCVAVKPLQRHLPTSTKVKSESARSSICFMCCFIRLARFKSHGLFTSPHLHGNALPPLLVQFLVVVVMHDEKKYARRQHEQSARVVHVFVIPEHIDQSS